MSKFKLDPKTILDLVCFVGASVSVYYLINQVVNSLDGSKSQNKKKANATVQKLQQRHPGLELALDEYEQIIVNSVIMPEDIKVGFKDIGGLDEIIDELRESILFPLTLMSTIMDKWFGESNKLVAAIFSLAHKLQPCIIFIDEIDSFLRERQSSDHEVTAMLKAEFMTLWDGLTSEGRILVLGATNRPNDIDDAILRRMPKRFPVKLPERAQRRRILEIMLKDAKVEPTFDIDEVATRTAGLSGSDIREACRNAAMTATRDYIRSNFENGRRKRGKTEVPIRPIKTEDFFKQTASETPLPTNSVGNIPVASDVE
ncbi:hypothetical protein DV495_001902 [Geotrichum candidum]|nr:hypothetical protein DV495_001902 [Geotrichum candidum]KAF7498518.1 hypothetical protein DV113_003471 [Geotrichum candidum]KAI8133152.1 hypothetical protein DUD61_003208 [Geotrichum candidum]